MKIPRIQVEEKEKTTEYVVPTKQAPENQPTYTNDQYPKYYTDGVAFAKVLSEEKYVLISIQRYPEGYKRFLEIKENNKNVFFNAWQPSTDIAFVNALKEYANILQRILDELQKLPPVETPF